MSAPEERGAAIVPGTEGYAREAPQLIATYESISPAEKYRPEAHLLPKAPARILDIGAGTGVDAAWFAAQGHRVVAVEPVRELREAGMALHRAQAIEWIDDALPGLRRLLTLGVRHDAVLLSAVWMHLDCGERRAAMANVAALLAPGAILVMSLRHGPVPAGRRMFEVSGAETISLAAAHGLRVVLEARSESMQVANRAAGITWTRLAFRAPAAA